MTLYSTSFDIFSVRQINRTIQVLIKYFIIVINKYLPVEVNNNYAFIIVGTI